MSTTSLDHLAGTLADALESGPAPISLPSHRDLVLATAMFAVGFLNFVKGGYSGVLPSLIAEQFPVETRAVGIAFSYGVSVTVFGGFAPLTATWLIAKTGDDLSPAYYLMVTGILSIIALTIIARRKRRAEG